MVDKSYIPPGSKFDLILNTRPGSKNAEKSLDYAVYSLWLLLHLGGIGSRSRRTAGSLAAVSPPTFDQLEFQLRPDTYAGIAQQLGESIANIRAGFNCSGQGGPFNKFSEFDVLHPQMCRIWLLGAWGSVEAAINNIGSRLREFRMLPGPDRMNVARWFDGEKIDTVERAVFGLPIQYRYLEKGARPVKVGSIQGRQRDPSIIRRSSPLWLKVVPVGDNYCGVATLFKSRFLPDQEGLHLQTGYKKVDPVPPPTDYSLIEQWVKDMFPKRVEVKYG
jgi:CRISPR-associated protein Cmr1